MRPLDPTDPRRVRMERMARAARPTRKWYTPEPQQKQPQVNTEGLWWALMLGFVLGTMAVLLRFM